MTDSPPPAPTGVARSPSETALATASMRALAAHDEREEVHGPDTLAELFLTEEQKAPLQDERTRAWVLKNKVAPGAYEFMIARTAFFDDLFLKALAGGIRQIVLLGAGCDSRACRFAGSLGEARVFELDAAPTQERKRSILQQGGVPIPSGVLFVPIDLASDDLAGVLLAAGFSRQETALFLWEGVTYYLTREAVDRTLAAIRALCIAGSSVSFDFASLSPGALSEDGIKRLREDLSARAAAEPTRFGIPQGKLEAFLSDRGFAIQEFVGPEGMQARYLTLRDGTLVGKVPALFSLVHAVAV